MNNKKGFILIEAVAAVVVISVSLTLISQSLMTNMRTGLRFQETVRMIFATENRLGLLYASQASKDEWSPPPRVLKEPYEKITEQLSTKAVSDNLTQADLTLSLKSKKGQHSIEVSTFIYKEEQLKNQGFLP